MLAAGAGSAKGIHLQFRRVDGDGIHFFGLRQYGDGAGRGVNAALGLGGGHALHAVRAGFELEARVHVLAGDARDDFLEAAVLAGALIHHFHVPAMGAGIVVVHAKKIAGENRRLVAAGGGADFEKDIAVVVRVLRQQQGLDLGFQFFNKLPGFRHLFLCHLADRGVFVLEHGARGFQLVAGRAIVAVQLHHRTDLGVFLRQLAELILFADDLGIGEQAFDFLEALRQAGEPCFDGRVHISVIKTENNRQD